MAKLRYVVRPVAILVGLLFLAMVNCALAYDSLEPPLEGVPADFRGIVFYSRLGELSLILPLACLLALLLIFLHRKAWLEALISVSALFTLAFFSFFVFSDRFFLYDSLHAGGKNYHVGGSADGEGWIHLAFCEESGGVATCDYFYTLNWGTPKLVRVAQPPKVLIELEEQIIYEYSGQGP